MSYGDKQLNQKLDTAYIKLLVLEQTEPLIKQLIRLRERVEQLEEGDHE